MIFMVEDVAESVHFKLTTLEIAEECEMSHAA